MKLPKQIIKQYLQVQICDLILRKTISKHKVNRTLKQLLFVFNFKYN